MELLKLLRIFRVVVVLALWGATIAVAVKLTRDWLDSGRHQKIGIDKRTLASISPPWVLIFVEAGSCRFAMIDCTISTWTQNGMVPKSCNEMILAREDGGDQVFVVNQSIANARGHKLLSKLDHIWIEFLLSNNTLKNCNGGGLDNSGLHLWVTPVASEAVVSMLDKGEAVPRQDLGASFSVGLGQLVTLSVTQFEEEWVNKTVNRENQFQVTQHPIVRPGDPAPRHSVEIGMLAGAFTVQRTVHKEGTQIWELFGTIFGWVGVFSGLCLQNLTDKFQDLMRRRLADEEEKKEREEEKAEELIPAGDGSSNSDAGAGQCPKCGDVQAELQALRARLDALERANSPKPMPTPPASSFPRQRAGGAQGRPRRSNSRQSADSGGDQPKHPERRSSRVTSSSQYHV
eukprot:TRINITY_DN5458_c1_g1_i1.p1 TRINITY_DN5458_c1_g1~~TRINITY_DN5458_c1_g1_i1.p1  ORF type:complete len:402 (+),score=147.14 TRINITY_DN5458_c1_g1_i1:75-1280(+)